MFAPSHVSTRRQAIRDVAVAIGGLALAPAAAIASSAEEISRSAESIHQEVELKARRQRVYEALMDSKKFDKVTQLSAAMRSGMSLGTESTRISRKAGGEFVIFGGHIVGRHIELLPNQRIVQAWRVVDWDRGVYSIAKFEIVEHGSGTRIVFDHTGFPGDQAAHLAAGWKGNYWEPLAKLLT
jgi:activator of HSP90 ATPase